MIHSLQNLIAALREELQQYGEMLARLDEQQECVTNRQADRLLETVNLVENQGLVIKRARVDRERVQQEAAISLGLDSAAEFSRIIPRLPEDYRPLVDALVSENNHLLYRIQQRARQNHLLLTQSIELMQRFLGTLFPGLIENRGYTDTGYRHSRSSPAPALYEAVG